MTKSRTHLPNIPDQAKNVFYTPPSNSPMWRQLLAYDPVKTFTLTTAEELPDLQQFLADQAEKLCCGYLSYDLGIQLKSIKSKHEIRSPLAVFHAYNEWYENVDGQWFDQAGDKVPLTSGQVPSSRLDLTLTPSLDRGSYLEAINKILDYIRAGDFYQINLTQRLAGATHLDPRLLFAELLRDHSAEHACYLEAGAQSIHSLSPELFLHHDQGVLTTEPIKGTRPRGTNHLEDQTLQKELLSSDKEQAELFMITDLLRNDLGKICEVGSVQLKAVKALKKLERVWHTASLIQGQRLQDLSPFDALLSMFPGGSITGCPKMRAMEVIDELELDARGIYTGSMGYIHPQGDFSFNIAIRTLIQEGPHLSLGTGGGITIDSDWQSEWDELLVKASTFK